MVRVRGKHIRGVASDFILLWLLLMVLMTLARVVFVLLFVSDESFADKAAAVLYGLPGDLAMSAYMMVVPLVCATSRVWTSRTWVRTLWRVWLAVVSSVMTFCYTLDAALYPYWGFRLDTTPFFYFFTSPAAAMASLDWYMEVLLFIFVAILAFGLYKLLVSLCPFNGTWGKGRRLVRTFGCVVAGALLFLCIRGGFSEATMTPGRGFFCNDMQLNKATVNPVFSLMYSVVHGDNPGNRFRFYEVDAEAGRVLDEFEKKQIVPDSIAGLTLKSANPDIYIIILESFSAQLMPSLGGEAIAPGLDSIAINHGALYTNFYAESFRTDRALPAILSGFPAQPDMSLIRFTSKLGNLPSLPGVFKEAGWHTRYYYGGDPDFTNMKAYLMAVGIDELISENDFKADDSSSKWGIPDGTLFKRVLTDNAEDKSSHLPTLTVIQTSSSHEPFDVPFRRFDNPAANAFAYTDSCLTAFIDELSRGARWNNTVVVIVPDHWGCYPEGLSDFKDRHHIPLVLCGGALSGLPARIDIVGSQADIAPTLAGMFGLDASDFVFGHDMFDATLPHYARISERDWFGIVDKEGRPAIVTIDDNRVLAGSTTVAEAAKAFIQLLYSDINRR